MPTAVVAWHMLTQWWRVCVMQRRSESGPHSQAPGHGLSAKYLLPSRALPRSAKATPPMAHHLPQYLNLAPCVLFCDYYGVPCYPQSFASNPTQCSAFGQPPRLQRSVHHCAPFSCRKDAGYYPAVGSCTADTNTEAWQRCGCPVSRPPGTGIATEYV